MCGGEGVSEGGEGEKRTNVCDAENVRRVRGEGRVGRRGGQIVSVERVHTRM